MKTKLLVAATLSLSSFIIAADEKKEHRHNPDELAASFIKKYDNDKNGTLNNKEFNQSKFCKDVTKRHGADEAQRIFSHSDNNKDGELNPSEVARIDQIKASAQYRKHHKGKRKL